MAMLPATERDPVAEKVVAALSSAIGSRVIVLFSHATRRKRRPPPSASSPRPARRAAFAV
jgi:hypothetical protein